MDFNFDTGTIFDGIQTIDPTGLPPLGGVAGVLTIAGTGALGLPTGTTLQEPTPAAGGWIRYNTDLTSVEYYNGTLWVQLAVGGGTVTSVAATTTSTGLAITGSPITSAGTFVFTLSDSLQALSTLGAAAGTGLVVQTGVNTFADVVIAGVAGNTVVTNGNGVAGNPTIDLAPITQATAGDFVKITLDGFGRTTGNTPVVTADITALVDGTYVNVTGDTMSGSLTFTGGSEVLGLPTTPSGDTAATSKAYVDSVAAGLSWKQAVIAGSTANIDLATGGLLTVDGITVTEGSRVLVKNQTDDTQNGIYIAHAGTWIRSSDMDTTTPINEVNGAAVYIEQGATQGTTGWTQIDNVTTIGTDPIQWSQFSGTGSYTAGSGLTLTGTVFSLTSPVAPALGGTGTSTVPTAGDLLIATDVGTYTPAALTAGDGVSIVSGDGSVVISSTGVTSVTGTTNQITATPTTGDVVLTLPTTLIAPGTLEVTTSLTVDTLTPNGALYVGTGGLVTSSTALQDGQILIGFTGAAPVAANITPGNGVQVVNDAGSITLSIDPSVLVTSFSAGTTGFTPATAISGDVVLAGLLNTANGGTGIDSSAAANGQLLIGSGAGLTLSTITAGTGITVSNGAGSITIDNTGVTSVGFVDASTTPIYTVTNSPVTTTGDLTITLNSQNANTVFAAPGGLNGQPSFRGLVYADLPLQLYVENPSTPVPPTVAGANSVAIGSGSSAASDNSFAQGSGALANLVGQRAYANGSFATAGDAQHGVYVLRGVTTDATPVTLSLDNAGALLVTPDNSVWTFSILVAGRRSDATGGGAAYKFEGAVRKDTTAGSITFIGNPSKTILGETNIPWDVTLTIDTVNGSFNVNSIGEAAKTIRWVATVLTTEVTN